MNKKANYKGKKYGLLTVMECLEESDGENNGGLWQCKCRCGKLVTMAGYRLHNRNSCGCLVKKAARERGIRNRKPQQVTYTAAYQQYKRSTISPMKKNDWLSIIVHPCYYCGNTDILNRVTEPGYRSTIVLHPEDQIQYEAKINQLVMVEGEIKPCCTMCRNMRKDISHNVFYKHVLSIVQNVQSLQKE